MSLTVMRAEEELFSVRTIWLAAAPRRSIMEVLPFLKWKRMPVDLVPSFATAAMAESRFAAKTPEIEP